MFGVTPTGTTVTRLCPDAYFGNITRTCEGGAWQEEINDCQPISNDFFVYDLFFGSQSLIIMRKDTYSPLVIEVRQYDNEVFWINSLHFIKNI